MVIAPFGFFSTIAHFNTRIDQSKDKKTAYLPAAFWHANMTPRLPDGNRLPLDKHIARPYLNPIPEHRNGHPMSSWSQPVTNPSQYPSAPVSLFTAHYS
jgi:hypothetical protein